MLSKEKLDFLHELLNDKEVKGKKLLKDFVWLNEHEPKYKVGECYLVTDRSCTICGKRVVNFKGKVREVMSFRGSETYRYGFDLEIICKGKKRNSYIAMDEEDVGVKVEDNINLLDDGNENEPDSIEVCI